MKKEDLKVKVQKIWNKYKGVIIVGAIAGAGYLIGYRFANWEMKKRFGKVFIITNDRLKHILIDGQERYGDSKNGIAMFTGIANESIKTEELGKLGECIKQLAESSEVKFTHFIAIGPGKEE